MSSAVYVANTGGLVADEWDGIDRRQQPHEYQMRHIIREELQPIKDEQREIQEKIAQWEFGATIFRYVVLAGVGILASASSLWEWGKTHLK